MAQLVEITSVCHLCRSSVAYSHHRVALFGKKKDSQERLASRISALLDITLNYDDGSANLMCAKCKRRVESLETVMMNLTKFKRSVAVLQLASYPGSRWAGKERAWYPLFAHALNLPEILVNRKLLCYIRIIVTR